MKDKILILIELERILFDQSLGINSDTLEIDQTRLNFSYIDFIDIDITLYFDNQFDCQNTNEICINIGSSRSGTQIPLFREIDTNDLTYFLLQEENTEIRSFLKEVKLENLISILDKVKSYVHT